MCRRNESLMQETVAASFVAAFRDLTIAHGADPNELDRLSGIELNGLGDPDARIPLANFKALVRAGQRLSGKPAMALLFGESADLAEISIVGLIGDASASFGAAFEALARYSRLTIDVELEEGAEGRRLVLEQIGGRQWLIDTRKNPNAFPEITESGFARMVTLARRLGAADVISAVHVTHAAPSYVSEYARIFPMPVMFDRRWNALQLRDTGWTAIRPKFPSPYMLGLLRTRAEELLESLTASETMRGLVEKALVAALSNGEIGMTEIADKLGVSRPTLFRRLCAEGVTFSEIRENLRSLLAAEYLRDRRYTVGEISQILGFSDQASFSRAFKRRTTKSPSQFRRDFLRS